MIIDDIKSRISIIEIAESEGLRLKKSGSGRYTSLCCFHDETKPSLTFDTDTNRFNCFACTDENGESGGDIINFYARIHGLSNSEAIKQLGEGLGIGMSKKPFKGLESPERAETKKKTVKIGPR